MNKKHKCWACGEEWLCEFEVKDDCPYLNTDMLCGTCTVKTGAFKKSHRGIDGSMVIHNA